MNIIIVEYRNPNMEQQRWEFALAAVDTSHAMQAIETRFAYHLAGKWSNRYGNSHLYTYMRRRFDNGKYQTIRFHEERLIGVTAQRTSDASRFLISLAK